MKRNSRYIPNSKDKAMVQAWSMAGIPIEKQAEFLGEKTSVIFRHYRDIYKTTAMTVTAEAVGKLYKAINEGNLTAVIFWLKTRAGFSEKTQIETPENSSIKISHQINSELAQILKNKKHAEKIIEQALNKIKNEKK